MLIFTIYIFGIYLLLSSLFITLGQIAPIFYLLLTVILFSYLVFAITQFTNYSYLCHELNTLIGSGNYCKYGADINCSTGTTTGSATANTLVSGLSFTIPYTNAAIGTNYPSQSIASTGVTGLTAILTTRTYNSATGNWSGAVRPRGM